MNSIYLDERFKYIFILPLSFGLTCLINYKIFEKLNNLIVLAVFVLYCCRNCVAILFLANSEYLPLLDDFNADDVNHAVFILSFEAFVVLTFLKLKEGKFKLNLIHGSSFVKKGVVGSRSFYMMVFFLTYVLVAWNQVPAISENFKTIFDDEFGIMSSVEINETVVRGGLDRIMLTSSLMVIGFLKFVVPVMVIQWARRRVSFVFVRFFILLLLFYIQLLLITSETMQTIVVIFVHFLVFAKVERVSFVLRNALFLSGGVVILPIVQLKFNGFDITNGFLSTILQAYIPGLSNLASTLRLNSDVSKIESLFSDVYSAIPFRNSLFDFVPSIRAIQLFNESNYVRGQIIPFIGEAYYYFGYACFLVPIIIVNFALKFYRRAVNSRDYLEYAVYLYIALFFAVSILFYHSTILISFFLTGALPLVYAVSFSSKRDVFK